MTEDLLKVKGRFQMRPYKKGCSTILIFTRSEEVKQIFRTMHLQDVVDTNASRSSKVDHHEAFERRCPSCEKRKNC